jgi:RNA polymerase sigma-70 factor, ECF subfamily
VPLRNSVGSANAERSTRRSSPRTGNARRNESAEVVRPPPRRGGTAVRPGWHASGAALFFRLKPIQAILPGMEMTEAELIAAVLKGDTGRFEPLVKKYLPRVFATARRYARRESEVEDIVQEVWLKAFQKLRTYRGDAPFEHWLMRLTVRTCYDALRVHQRNREATFTELSDDEYDWLERFGAQAESPSEASAAAKALVDRLLEMLSPSARLVITLLEIEEKSVKEISKLTGWSVPLVKVRAFRARAEMKKCLARIARGKYL